MKKENLPVIIAIALPVLLVLAVALSVYVPNIGARPQYDFLYTQTSWPYSYSHNGSQCTIYKNYYEIENGKVVLRPANATSTLNPKSSYMDPAMVAYPAASSRISPAFDPCQGYSRIVRKDSPELYIYKSASDETSVISYEDVSKLTLADGLVSPDGFSISSGYRSSGIFDIFDGGSNYELVAQKKNKRVRLSIPDADLYMYGDRSFGFIGWINK